MEVELEGEVSKEVGQFEDQGHYLSLNVEWPTTHKNTPKGNEVGELTTTIYSTKEKQLWRNCNTYPTT